MGRGEAPAPRRRRIFAIACVPEAARGDVKACKKGPCPHDRPAAASALPPPLWRPTVLARRRRGAAEPGSRGLAPPLAGYLASTRRRKPVAGHRAFRAITSSRRLIDTTRPKRDRQRPRRLPPVGVLRIGAAGKVNRRAVGRTPKPAIASGRDPIPFRTWKSNLASLSCY